ncbi:hypothetical protein GGX14DRAFT_480356 [Mycena pura]|uniref:CFEM domain-containing protein n=1 Tax=Mycena pura TaxID=153505 RepID=A0AAD6UQ59_9AGAR|nr:hypothetical protein GGX14DRAFT_480356 [Mycena pura]
MQSLATLTVVLSVVLSAAGQATTLPQCASGCADHAASTVGCALTDTPCLCKTSFPSSVLQCAGTTSCSAADQTRVSNILEAMCDIGESCIPHTPRGGAHDPFPLASGSASGSGGSPGCQPVRRLANTHDVSLGLPLADNRHFGCHVRLASAHYDVHHPGPGLRLRSDQHQRQ